MKTIKLSLSKATMVLLFLSLAVTACKKGPELPPQKNCDQKGYFQEMQGYNGYYGDYIIRLESGALLFPCIVEDRELNKQDIYDGMLVTVSYKKIGDEEIACKIPYENHNRMDISFGCFEYIKAKITCIGDGSHIDEEPQYGWCGTK